MSDVRARLFARLRERIGPTSVGRSLGLSRIRSFDDFRAVVPILDPGAHDEQVGRYLGFGVTETGEVPGDEAAGLAAERADQAAALRAFAGRTVPKVGLWLGRVATPAVTAALVRDVEAVGPVVHRVEHLADPEDAVAGLVREGVEVLVATSMAAVRLAEGAVRRSIEDAVPTLRALVALFDLSTPVRSGLPTRALGRIVGPDPVRVTVASARAHRVASTLAMGSALLELLPEQDPEVDGRARVASETILPEAARPWERYEVVVSSAVGVLRLRTGLHVRVVGFDPPCGDLPVPRPRVVPIPAPPPDLALEGCTLAGAWVAAAVRQAFRPEDPALVAAEVRPDFLQVDAGAPGTSGSLRLPPFFAETELGATAGPARPAGGTRPRGLWVGVEVQGHAAPELAERLSKRVDEDLRRRVPAYDYLRGRGALAPPRVEVLAAGAYETQRLRAVRRLSGPAGEPDVRVRGAAAGP